MRIGAVAVGTLLECQWLLEICFSVTPHALDLGVFSKQREFRLGVVECAVEPRLQNLVPSGCAVAGLAGLRKAATVGIRVAIGAAGKGYTDVARLPVRPQGVATLAGHLNVQTREGIPCGRMIKFPDRARLPISRVVALQAVNSEPAVVLVLMTDGAT